MLLRPSRGARATARRTVATRSAVLAAPIALALVSPRAQPEAAHPPRAPTPSPAPTSRPTSRQWILVRGGHRELGFATSGKPTSVRVHVGDRVKAGQVLAKIDATAAKAALAQAKGNLHAQQAGLDRLTSSTTVAGSQSTVSQANAIVDATTSRWRPPLTPTTRRSARAKAQLAVDEDAKDQANSALKAVEGLVPRRSSSGSSAGAAAGTLAQQALQHCSRVTQPEPRRLWPD